jgi:hypothetical protein
MRIDRVIRGHRAFSSGSFLLFACVALLIYPFAGCLPKEPPHPEAGVPTQANTDGYQYQADGDRPTDFIYNQLWYFNFLDENLGIAGVAAYGLANPENLMFQQGLANSYGMIIRDGTSFDVWSPQWDAAVPGNFSASATFDPGPGFELQNPVATIDVISPDHYHVQGHVIDGNREIQWDLHYERGLGSGWRPWVNWPVPYTMEIFPAWVDYHMQMANAVVNGTFRVVDGGEEELYELVNAKGYHDGFHSKFVFSIFEWDWCDYKQDNLSVHLLHPHGPEYACQGGWETCLPGNLRVQYDNGSEVKDFNFYRGKNPGEKQVWIEYNATAVDPAYPDVEYPTEETITALDEEGNSLTLHWSLIRYMIVYFDVPDPFFDTVTFEIIADFHGEFYEASTGTTVPILGTGWADWSGPAFPEAAGNF